MLPTLHLLEDTDFPAIQRDRLSTLQVNLGYRCNQQCLHCHVNAGPKRTEEMDETTCATVLRFMARQNINVLDLTGGAPELNPHFRSLVERASASGVQVMDRCNLTILTEPGQQDTASFLAQHKVEVVASLPCYLEDNVDKQRGKGIFEKSLSGLRQLNALGYGRQDSGLTLNLVYNPQGPQLPPPQQQLEADYKKHLLENYGIHFNSLFTLTNMPIKRFGSTLISKGEFDPYMKLLREACQPANIQSVMCRSLISVDWRGYVYDCDFNQMLDMPLMSPSGEPAHLDDLMDLELEGGDIRIADHCYGCTAGQGSSCGGALND